MNLMLQNFTNPLVTLHELTLNLLSKDDPDALLQELLDEAIAFTNAESGSIALLDEERKHLIIRVFRGLDKSVPEKVKLKIGEGVTGRCILTGKTRNVGNTGEDPYYIEVRSDILSELAIPLKVGGKTFGVLSVDSSRLQAFSTEHSEHLEVLASYAAQIFTNQQTLKNLGNRTRLLEVLIEVSQVLGKYPTVEEVFSEIINLLEKKVNLYNAAIFLWDNMTDELKIVAGSRLTAEEKERARYKSGEGITGRVYAEKKAISIPDLTLDDKYLNKSRRHKPDVPVSFFASPLYLNDEVQGVFTMELPYSGISVFEDFSFLVQILSSLFSQAMKIQQLIHDQATDIQYENIALRRQLQDQFSFDNIIGTSEKMRDLFERIKMAADSASSILLIGESGTGKEMIATALHQNSMRRDKPLVKINCAAIPADLLESELFGYARGAFTGAVSDKRGKFLVAHEGTIFLDEIGEMDYRLQSKLLRILQEKEFSPLGSNKVYRVDVRIIAATNANLDKLIKQKKFRADLYYRLNVVRLEIPSLRERMEDLPLLCQHLVEKIARQNRKKISGVTPAVLQLLSQYPFPGNVRELENMIERAIVLTRRNLLDVDDFPLPNIPQESGQERQTVELSKINSPLTDMSPRGVVSSLLKTANPGSYRENVIGKLEAELIYLVLKKNLMHKAKTAADLGINRLTLDRKIRDYNIDNMIRDESQF